MYLKVTYERFAEENRGKTEELAIRTAWLVIPRGQQITKAGLIVNRT